jgi:hypothetical protein
MTTVKESPNGSKSPSFFRSVVSKLKPPVASVSSGAQQPLPSPLKSQISDLPSPESVSRCEFTFSDGRQCLNPAKVYPPRRNVYQQDELSPHQRVELSPVKDKKVANSRASFCAHHAKQKRGAKHVSDASALEALCSDLTTATNINRALAQTFLLMAQGRISRKDAVAFGYLSQLLLQSVSGVRAEYVAAFGYRQWENKLKTSLMANADDDPEPSPENPGNEPDGVILSDSAPADERGISPNPYKQAPSPDYASLLTRSLDMLDRKSPIRSGSASRENNVNEGTLRDPASTPDYASLLRRSLDMLDRKYDTTPEGRSEANKLALELDLMKPAPAKPAKDYFGRVVDLVRRCREGEARKGAGGPEPSSLPPEAFLNYYGHPIKLAVPPAGGTATPGCAHPNPSASRSESPTASDPAACSSAPVSAAVPETQRSCAPSASDPADFVAPPSRRHRKPRSRSSAPGSAPHSELPLPLPISATAAKPDSAGGPDADHHEGHQTDWYAPPSWSKTRPLDPCPSRKEKLQRKLRSMSNSAFRRLQHQNARGFWNKGLQKLTP